VDAAPELTVARKSALDALYYNGAMSDPLSGQLFCFRGRSGNLLKVIWHDGQGACHDALGTRAASCGRAQHEQMELQLEDLEATATDELAAEKVAARTQP
jgi:hypothetical protein